MPIPDIKITLGTVFEVIILEQVSSTSEGIKCANATFRGASLVYNALSQPLTANCATCGKSHEFKLPVQLDPKADRPPSNTAFGQGWDLAEPLVNPNDSDRSKWEVTIDQSVKVTPQEWETLGDKAQDRYNAHPVELKSRILRLNGRLETTQCLEDATHVHEIDYREAITAVLTRLSEAFNGIDGNPYLYVNETCGFHVHIGNQKRRLPTPYGQARSLHFHRLRKAPRLRPHRRPRRRNSAVSEHFFAASYSRRQQQYANNLALDNGEDRILFNHSQYPLNVLWRNSTIRKATYECHVAAWAKLILSAPTLQAVLVQGLNGHATTLNLENLGKGQRQTIEFRQHAGTVDSEAVLAYVDFVVHLVLHANNTSEADYGALVVPVDGKFLHPNFGIIDLLAELGCTEAWLHYGEKTEESHYRSYDALVKMPRQRLKAGGSPFARLAGFVLEKAWRVQSSEKITKRITEKVLAGGYGQFSEDPLEMILGESITDEERKRLVISEERA